MKLKNVVASFCLLAGTIATTTLIVSSPVSAAADDPSVVWTTTNNSNVSGVFTISASAAPSPTGTARIKKWCLTINGVAANETTRARSPSDLFYANYDSNEGCWSATFNLTTATFSYDSTAWADGNTTYQITVTDTSNRSATSTILKVNYANEGPTVHWRTTNDLNVVGWFNISAMAEASSFGTATIKKWCLTENGAPTKGSTAKFGEPALEGQISGLTFFSETGCWESSFGTDLDQASFSYDSTAWADGNTTYQITVTDTSNRSATSTILKVNYANEGPTVTWVTSNNSVVSGPYSISAIASPSPTGTAFIKRWCLTIDGVPATADTGRFGFSPFWYMGYSTINPSTGCWDGIMDGAFRFSDTAWANGSVNYQVTVTDTSNRTATSSVLTLNKLRGSTDPAADENNAAVAWVTNNNSIVSGMFVISARAAGSVSPQTTIKKWCLTINGNPATVNVAGYGSSVYNTIFDSTTGCWSGTDLNSAIFRFDSTAWVNGSVTYQVTVTDTSNRTATSSILTINFSNAGPEVSWATTNNSNVSGMFYVAAYAVTKAPTGTATIKKWCLTINGVPATTRSSVYDSTFLHSSSVSFNPDTGCWSGSNLSGFGFSDDSTAWANGSVTYQVTATDTSNRTATSSILTINFSNAGPEVSWATTNNSNVSGVFTITAAAAPAPTGTATIKKWCLTINGVPATTDNTFSSSSISHSSDASFNPDIGCWTRTSNNTSNLTTAKFDYDSTAWVNGSVTYQVTVTDTSNRTATSTGLVVTTTNPQPTASLSGVGGGVSIQSSAGITASIYHPGADSIRTWCFRVSNGPCNSGTSQSNGTSRTNGLLSLDVSTWVNGTYTLSASAVDSVGRTIAASPQTFVVNNPPASGTAPRISHKSPAWNSKTTTAYVRSTLNYANSATIYWGTSTRKMKSTRTSVSNGDKTFTVSGLKPNTMYFFKITTFGANGSSTTKTVKSKTLKIPPKPKRST